jgi:hypothetical protein
MSLGYQRPIQPRSRSLVLPFINQVAKTGKQEVLFWKKEPKKLLFLESRLSRAGALKSKVFCVFFFQKRSASLLVPAMPT